MLKVHPGLQICTHLMSVAVLIIVPFEQLTDLGVHMVHIKLVCCCNSLTSAKLGKIYLHNITIAPESKTCVHIYVYIEI